VSLDPASYPELWAINAQTGVRPEWLLPVLQAESGLRPDIPNQAGEPFYGLNQISKGFLDNIGVTPADYLAWPASRQLSTVVKPYIQNQINHYGPLRSGTRLYQANFLPATLLTARHLTDVVTEAPSPYYTHNAGLDPKGKGNITLQDLANFISRAASTQAVKDAIAQAYNIDAGIGLNPHGAETDPVYGEDFGIYEKNRPWLIGAVILIVSGAVAYYVTNEMDVPAKRSARRRRRLR
jgi:hypothetical protein